ncbi:hypothetical protein LEP1GSC092_0032 [Leptospira interrogans serovar Pyrogenes str. R168]|nr:hypothetical protein LEP1GSC092_0032 [Leptospira interrogans serovar Pyrogenes str. R168]
MRIDDNFSHQFASLGVSEEAVLVSSSVFVLEDFGLFASLGVSEEAVLDMASFRSSRTGLSFVSKSFRDNWPIRYLDVDVTYGNELGKEEGAQYTEAG